MCIKNREEKLLDLKFKPLLHGIFNLDFTAIEKVEEPTVAIPLNLRFKSDGVDVQLVYDGRTEWFSIKYGDKSIEKIEEVEDVLTELRHIKEFGINYDAELFKIWKIADGRGWEVSPHASGDGMDLIYYDNFTISIYSRDIVGELEAHWYQMEENDEHYDALTRLLNDFEKEEKVEKGR